MSTATSTSADTTWQSPRHRRTVYMILAIVGISILFDGYDLVVYGAVLSDLLDNPHHIGQLSPAVAGTLGSWAMIGVMIGALSAGAVGDRLGRRKVMITAIIWFSLGMAATAMATSILAFGALRFATGLGVGMIVATGGAIIAEFAPAGRRNLFNAIVYSGVPAGGVMATVLALLLHDAIGWRGLFLIGGSPLLFLLPLAFFALPESPRWLMSRGRTAEAAAECARFGLPESQFLAEPKVIEDSARGVEPTAQEKTGFAAIFSNKYLRGTLLIGIMSFIGLLATYGLNTWLPTIREAAGATPDSALYSLLALNGSAVVGGLIASWFADRIGAKKVITTTFVMAAISLTLLPFTTNMAMVYLLTGVTGIGIIGTQVLTYGLSSNFYGTSARAAGVAWCAGFGRIGGIAGPALGGLIIGMGLAGADALFLFAGAAVVGAIATALIPRSPAETRIIETVPAAQEPAMARPAPVAERS
ncbi:MFS transporter [Corynebacterium guangdongense]|uniref:AAHS family benzoate transporter-like MFS transporter n=1 Tax=Corynebacterium guangdongense TaxID=1783348 RepID=A0ABU1ZYR5_9CORY|nr:aromatic acid/H+ symport family MFS transporter [Corynebacterium guangdongense]MDR7330083.1 AAHS family benzoate transporter-like MFS transporter [Corynebacterium guangdongense]WJZ18641.1 4-hydroxybenzoate transporter PcaK [Corynebacterium guangdongense]